LSGCARAVPLAGPGWIRPILNIDAKFRRAGVGGKIRSNDSRNHASVLQNANFEHAPCLDQAVRRTEQRISKRLTQLRERIDH
jgi:hypothetical protein